MKKIISLTLLIIIIFSMLSLSQPIFAESTLPDAITGIKTVSLSSSPAYYKGKALMVPAAEAAKAIGYYVYKYEDEGNYIIYDKYGRYAIAYPTYNAYASNEYLYKVLSAASEVKGGKLYVPVDVFTKLLLFDRTDADGSITFTDHTTYNIAKLTNPRLFRTDLTYKDNEDTRFVVSALRGYSYAYPENTMLAYRKAIELGVDEIKVDVQLSKDGVPVLIHDTSIDPTGSGNTVNIADMTLDELKKIDVGVSTSEYYAGERIPTLEELFSYIKPFPSLMINVEPRTKTKETVDAIAALLEKYSMKSKVLFTTNDADLLAYAFDHYGLLTQGYTPGSMDNYVEGKSGTLSKMKYILFDDMIAIGDIIYPYYNDGFIPYTTGADSMEQVKAHLEAGSVGLICSDPTSAIIWLRTNKMR